MDDVDDVLQVAADRLPEFHQPGLLFLVEEDPLLVEGGNTWAKLGKFLVLAGENKAET